MQESYGKIKLLEDEQSRMSEEIWLAKERISNQERELHDLRDQCSWLRDENARLQSELEEEWKKVSNISSRIFINFNRYLLA